MNNNGQLKRTVNRAKVSLSPSMVTAIKQAPKGKLPPGLARYLANKKKGGK